MINVDMMNPIEHIYTDGGSTIVDINSLPYYDNEQYDLFDEKDYKKYINDVERIVRTSFEYRALINYLKNVEGMNVCSFLDNVSSEDGARIKIEIHHSPLTLFDICSIVITKRQRNGDSLNVFDVAEEVMWLHYAGWVGLIPLAATTHEMVHNGYLFVPTNVVRGNYQALINNYHDYISPELLDCINSAEQATKKYIAEKQMEVFNNHKLYINSNGSYTLPRIDEIQSMVKGRVNSIKNKKTLMTVSIKPKTSN